MIPLGVVLWKLRKNFSQPNGFLSTDFLEVFSKLMRISKAIRELPTCLKDA